MGIGVSYTGHDGKTRHFDNGETARKFLDSIAPEAKRHTGEALRHAMQGLPSPMQGMSNRTRVLPGGSVVESPNGLCLRGEETSPLVEGVKMFASVNGSKGFKTIAEIDPPGSTPLKGPAFGCDDEDEDASVVKAGEAASIPFLSRTKSVGGEWRQQELNGENVTCCEICDYEYIREMEFSASGRMVGCTKERRRLVKKFTIYLGGGSGNGKYGVRPFWRQNTETDEAPMLDFLAFGAEKDLDTWNEGEGRFECNYPNGQLSENPPVKIVYTDSCAYNPLTGGE